jgi:hypothetical protein
MRFATMATLVVTLAAVSTASAQDTKGVKSQSPKASQGEVTNTGAPVDAPYGGLTPKQHAAITYHPCRDAKGWKDGKLVCDNRY